MNFIDRLIARIKAWFKGAKADVSTKYEEAKNDLEEKLKSEKVEAVADSKVEKAEVRAFCCRFFC